MYKFSENDLVRVLDASLDNDLLPDDADDYDDILEIKKNYNFKLELVGEILKVEYILDQLLQNGPHIYCLKRMNPTHADLFFKQSELEIVFTI